MSASKLGLILVATLAVAGTYARNSSYTPQDKCTSNRVNLAAETAFFGFAKDVAPCWQHILVRILPSQGLTTNHHTTQESSTYDQGQEITSEGLQALIPDGTKPQCLGELVIVNGSISVGRLLFNHEVCNATVWRMHVIRIALTHLWTGSAVFQPMHIPIRFWCAETMVYVQNVVCAPSSPGLTTRPAQC